MGRGGSVMPELISVEVAFASPSEQALLVIEMAVGSTAADAIRRSGLQGRFPEHDFDAMQIGVWGRPVRRDYPVMDGDRIEIYRPLLLDPRDARRRLARAGRSMGQALEDDRQC